MFRRPSKKQLLIRRVIVAVVMTLSVIVIVTGTILFVLGYRLDSNNGRLEQGALVQFESTPSGADVAIDGASIGARTATKKTVMAGTHSFIMTRDGYQPWAKSLDLAAGTLTWLDYIRLVPQDLTPQTIEKYETLFASKASPDHKKLILQQSVSSPTFIVADLRSDKVNTASLTLPKDVYSEATKKGVVHSFTLASWDSGGRYLLLKHAYGSNSEWIVMDTEDVSKSINVSRLLSISLSNLYFSGTNGRQLYGLTTDGVIRKLDLSEETISRALVTNVTSFTLFETGTITYVGTAADSGKRVVGVYREGDSEPHVLKTITSKDTPLAIATSRYFSDDYVAIAEGLKVTILKGRYPASGSDDTSSLQQYASFTIPARIDQLTFSRDGAYVVARSGLNFTSYEIEYQRLTNALVETAETKAHDLNWLDEAYVWSIYDSTLSIREFDGTNVHAIGAATPGFDAVLSENGKYLYSVTKIDGTYRLQRVTMILN